MRAVRVALIGSTPTVLSAVLLAVLLAGCQETAPKPPLATTAARPAAAAGDEPRFDTPGRLFRQGKGWIVKVHGEGSLGERFCLVSRADGGGPKIAFSADADEGRLLLDGVGGDLEPGETVNLTAAFDDGAELPLEARALPGSKLSVTFPIQAYEDSTQPFKESRNVAFRARNLGRPFEPIELKGSSWAINALDECRILNLSR